MKGHDAIEIDHACKFIKKRPILDDITLSLRRGGVYGFVGANGSGKTMLLKAVAGLVHLTSGEIRVFGNTVGKDCSFPPNTGCMFNSLLWEEYSGYENLHILASVKKEVGDPDLARTLERVGLDPNDVRPYRSYSMGMRQRLDLAQAIMEKPELLILDEPSNALDSGGLTLLCDIVREEHERGTTILLSSHNTPELAALCEVIFELSDGRVVEGGRDVLQKSKA